LTSVRGRKHELYTESPNSQRRRERHVKSKVKGILIIFFNVKEIVHREFVLAGQTVNYSYYCGVLRRMRENM
jgi:hypothetical protein